MDGKLDDPEWEEVGFTEDFVDIATDIIPQASATTTQGEGCIFSTVLFLQFRTRAKIRWSDNFLYVGAMVEVCDMYRMSNCMYVSCQRLLNMRICRWPLPAAGPCRVG